MPNSAIAGTLTECLRSVESRDVSRDIGRNIVGLRICAVYQASICGSILVNRLPTRMSSGTTYMPYVRYSEKETTGESGRSSADQEKAGTSQPRDPCECVLRQGGPLGAVPRQHLDTACRPQAGHHIGLPADVGRRHNAVGAVAERRHWPAAGLTACAYPRRDPPTGMRRSPSPPRRNCGPEGTDGTTAAGDGANRPHGLLDLVLGYDRARVGEIVRRRVPPGRQRRGRRSGT